MGFSCVREEEGKRYKYNGDVDFAIGHSSVDSKLSKDCALLVVEAKTVAKLSDAMGQTLAQAATNYLVRKKANRGREGESLKVFWCTSDGESWKFGFIEAGAGGKLNVYQAPTKTSFLRCTTPERESCTKLFSHIIHWVRKSIDSSQRSSRRSSEVNNSVDLEELETEFISVSIDK